MELKYRRLTQEELQEMEKEFIDFLVINGISSDEWLVLKEQNNEKVEKIIDLFSEAVLETVYRKVSYLEHVSAREVLVFHASSASIQL
ncbi:MAG: putative aldo/keto reductase-like oxidoreductase, partial [Cyclobacteriaceae bacterium]